MALTFNTSYLKGFMADHEIDALAPFIKTSHDMLHAGTGIWYEGGRTIVADAPLERMPLFLREGRQAYLDEMLR